jgi:hypothetical protein
MKLSKYFMVINENTSRYVHGVDQTEAFMVGKDQRVKGDKEERQMR